MNVYIESFEDFHVNYFATKNSQKCISKCQPVGNVSTNPDTGNIQQITEGPWCHTKPYQIGIKTLEHDICYVEPTIQDIWHRPKYEIIYPANTIACIQFLAIFHNIECLKDAMLWSKSTPMNDFTVNRVLYSAWKVFTTEQKFWLRKISNQYRAKFNREWFDLFLVSLDVSKSTESRKYLKDVLSKENVEKLIAEYCKRYKLFGSTPVTLQFEEDGLRNFMVDMLKRSYEIHNRFKKSKVRTLTQTGGVTDLIKENKPSKIVVMGDIHGDFVMLLHLLLGNGIIKKVTQDELYDFKVTLDVDKDLIYYRYTGKDTMMVFVGDVIDGYRPNITLNGTTKTNDYNITNTILRKSNYTDQSSIPRAYNEVLYGEVKIIELLNTLHLLSSKEGGGVVKVCGNHELINILEPSPLNQKYATPLAETVRIPYTSKPTEDGSTNRFVIMKNNTPPDAVRMYSRDEFFKPGGPGFDLLRHHNFQIIARLDNILFVHGGISSTLSDQIKDILKLENKELYIRSGLVFDEINTEFKKSLDNLVVFSKFSNVSDKDKILHEIFYDSNSLTWNRTYGSNCHKDGRECDELSNTFETILGSQHGYLVIAHCSQHIQFNKHTKSKKGGWFFPVEKTIDGITYFYPSKTKYSKSKGLKYIGSGDKIDPRKVTINVGCIRKNVTTVRCDVGMSSAFLDLDQNTQMMQKPASLIFKLDKNKNYQPHVMKLTKYDAFHAIDNL